MIAVDSIRDLTVDDRLRGAVWGQFIGDAAALGTHWIYDLDELRSKFPRGVTGFETPIEGHYHFCLLYTSPSPRDLSTSRMPSSA